MAVIKKQLELEESEEDILAKASQVLKNIRSKMAVDETLYDYDSRPSIIAVLYENMYELYNN